MQPLAVCIVATDQIFIIYRRFKKTERTKRHIQSTYCFSDPCSIITLVEIRQSIDKNITSDWSRSCHPLQTHAARAASIMIELNDIRAPAPPCVSEETRAVRQVFRGFPAESGCL